MSRFEIGAAFSTGALYLLLSLALDLHGPFLAAAVLFWTGFLVLRVRRDPGSWTRWGLSSRNLRPAFVAASAVAAAAVAILEWTVPSDAPVPLDRRFLALLLLYPVWGLTQQFLVQALVVRNLALAPRPCSSPALLVPLSALLFGVVHLPDLRLMGATLLLGLAFTPIYLRWRNLWPLGLYHGWLGAWFYFRVLGRDPWLELA